MDIPRISKVNGIDTLIVHGEPFFALAGEIHNSSASDAGYMLNHVWPRLEGLNINTLIVPIYWEQIEPCEGEFHFELLDSLIRQARENRMHLILLWFGLWKNAGSDYVPEWMKLDNSTYFRAQNVHGEPLAAISPFCAAAVERDARALAAVMAHIRSIDEEQNTVIMMQIENEIGLLGSDRDYSETAETAFAGAVPPVVAAEFGCAGTWRECFADDAGEHLMAFAFASALENITRRAKQAYDLPCFANAWLRQYPWHAGSYPSGGPVRSMHRIWKCVAPSLFTLAPDIYVPYVAQVIDEYGYDGNPLVIPEVRKDAVTASYALYAFGHANAICYSPFGIEELALPPEAVDRPPLQMMAALNIDPSAFDITGSREYLARTYGILHHVRPLLLKYRGTRQLQSFVKKSDTDFGAYLSFGKVDMKIAYAPKQPSNPLAAGIIIEVAEDSFFLIGMMCEITLRAKPGERGRVGILRLEDGDFVDGTWQKGRTLNGDEKMMLRLKDMPECRFVKVHVG